MSLSDAVGYATMASIALAAFGVWWGVRTYRGQMNAQLFLAFTERYDTLMREAPPEFRTWRLNTDVSPPEVTPDIRKSILAYLNLCSQEYYLWRSGYLDGAIWGIWSNECARTLRSDLLRKEWPELRAQFQSFEDYCEFVDQSQRDQ